MGLVISPVFLERFRADLDPLVAAGRRIGIGVSGGPDSLALLLLASASRPGQIEAATIDHALRPGSREEAEMVARVCAERGIPHNILSARWAELPETAIQERARNQRYRLLGFWAEERGLTAIMTAHHADDQAETLLMRLARGAGVRGLAGMRDHAVTPGSHVSLLRPLLGWRHRELEAICADAGLSPVTDPSNEDERFERVRIRNWLADCPWLDGGAVAQSAANLADADTALDWAMRNEWRNAVVEKGGTIVYRRGNAPAEIVRRIVTRAIRKLATEGDHDLRGRDLDQLLCALVAGSDATLRGVHCRGGIEWRFSTAPPRRR